MMGFDMKTFDDILEDGFSGTWYATLIPHINTPTPAVHADISRMKHA
jgi:hypothetical protein